MKRAWCLALLIVLSGCGELEKMRINEVLDARAEALMNKDIAAYAELIAPDYHDRGKTREEVLDALYAQMQWFDRIEVKTTDRTIRLIDDRHAICEQTYRMRVVKGDQARELVQREQLKLVKTDQGWRISGGL